MRARDGIVWSWALIAAVLALDAYRAASQSITHDEARVYQLYMQGSVLHAFTYTGIQNHVLQALLSRLALVILPASAFAIRLPTLLAAALYCVLAVNISARLIDDRRICFATVALLTLNPYTLDFLSAARGYGLVLAFLLAATYLLLPGVTSLPERLACALAGACLGLAMAATTACAFAVAGILFAFTVCQILSGRWRDGLVSAVAMAVVAAAVSAVVLANQLYRTTVGDYQGAFALGGRTFSLELASLVRATARHVNPYLDTLAELTLFERAACAVLAIAMAAVIVAAFSRIRAWSSRSPRERALVWMVMVLVAMTAASIGAHVVAGVTYPQGRMALFWLPFITFAAMLALATTPARRVSRAAGWALTIAALAVYAGHLQTTTYADWDFDAGNRALIAALIEHHGDGTRRASVRGSWVLEPSINFYRLTMHLDWLMPMERETPSPGGDYYVLVAEDGHFADALGLRAIFVDPVAGSTLAVPVTEASAALQPRR